MFMLGFIGQVRALKYYDYWSCDGGSLVVKVRWLFSLRGKTDILTLVDHKNRQDEIAWAQTKTLA